MKQSKKTFKEPALVTPQASLAPKVLAKVAPQVPATVAMAPKKPKPQLTPTDFFIDIEYDEVTMRVLLALKK